MEQLKILSEQETMDSVEGAFPEGISEDFELAVKYVN